MLVNFAAVVDKRHVVAKISLMTDSFAFVYCNGMCAACYFLTCLMCGLQLRFGILGYTGKCTAGLGRVIGNVMLAMSFASVFYILSSIVPKLEFLWRAGYAADYVALVLVAFSGHYLYSNSKPSVRTITALGWPFLLLLAIFAVKPMWYNQLIGFAAIVLILDFVYYSAAFVRRERSLEHLYSDPESHSLKWMWSILLLLIGWLALHVILNFEQFDRWHDMVLYLYMSCVVLFSYSKINSYGEPVSPEVQEQIDEMEWNQEIPAVPESTGTLQETFVRLLETERVYCNPNLTVDDVVRRLGTNTKYFSSMLHNDMQTTFCRLINSYRIDYAKELLKSTDDKVENIGLMCGFNSRQSFYQNFTKMTGKTPVEWRKM